MFCRQCGAEIGEDTAYCGMCGAKVIKDVAPEESVTATPQREDAAAQEEQGVESNAIDHGEGSGNGTEGKGKLSTPEILCIVIVTMIIIGVAGWLIILFLRWAFSSFILAVVLAAGGYILYHKKIGEMITGYFYKEKSKKLQLPEGMSASMLLEALSGKFNYPYFKGVHYGTEGECIIEGEYSAYPVVFNEDNIAEISYISKENDKRKRTVLLEAMTICDYINKFFNPNLPIDVEKDMKKLKLAEGQRKAVAIVWAAASVLIAAALIWDFVSPGSLQSMAIPGIEVRSAYLSQYSKKVTIEEAFDNFFDNGKWTKYDSEGYTNVVFTGSCLYSGERADVRIIFKITGENFIVDSLDINGRSQNDFVLMSLLSAVYEGY